MVTLKDIALEANVSIMTVSNVINGRHNKVSANTINKINALIEKYNFIPNQTARNLVGKSSHIIGLIYPSANGKPGLTANPYNSELVSALEHHLNKENYYLLLRSVTSLKDALTVIKTWNLDGAIFLGSFEKDIQNLKIMDSTPMILVDHYVPNNSFTNVGVNDFEGEKKAVTYLIEQGHKEIAFVSAPFLQDTVNVLEQRYQGYCSALTQNEIRINPNYRFTCNMDTNESASFVHEIITKAPKVTAICCASDMIAMGVIDGMKKLNIAIPKEYSVIGFDNLPSTFVVTPRLTSVQQNVQKKARIVANLLLEQVRKKYVKPSKITLDLSLSIKDSVSFPRE